MRPCGIFNANMQTRYMFVCTLSEPVFVQNTIGPALCKTAASVVSALASVLFGIDVLVCGLSMCLAQCLSSCISQLRNQSQSSCTMASINWLDVQRLYFSVRFSQADSGKSGRRASVLQALLSAYLPSANSLYIYAGLNQDMR